MKCVKCDKELNSGDDCQLMLCSVHKNKSIIQGWQCPICGTVYSPYKLKCDNFHGKLATRTTENKQYWTNGRNI